MNRKLQLALAFFVLLNTLAPLAGAVEKVDAGLAQQLAEGQAEALIRLQPLVGLEAARQIADRPARLAYVVTRLKAHAAATQGSVLDELRTTGSETRSYWINNSIAARIDLHTAKRLAARPEVLGLHPADAGIGIGVMPRRQLAKSDHISEEVGANLEALNAPAVWALGHAGEGVTVAALDTGVAVHHAGLRNSYRGFDKEQFDHDYNWFDVFKDRPELTLLCPPDQPTPCDDSGHGTMVMGLIVGAEPDRTVGVAPDADWMACRGLANPQFDAQLSAERPLACWQWMMEPTRVDGSDPDIRMAPDIINNSFSCQPDVPDCANPDVYRDAVQALEAAGFIQVGSAGLRGPDCQTLTAAPGTYEEMLTVGAMNSNFSIFKFSSRGPVFGPDGELLVKPDVVAPGVFVLTTAHPFGYDRFLGSEAATAQTSGAAALLLSANPGLRGKPALTRSIIRASALPLLSGDLFQPPQDCGGLAADASPNGVFGFGSVDALEAVRMGDPMVGEISGFWLDPEQPGTGIHVQISSNGEGQPLAVVTWYTFDAEGRPVWRIGSAELEPGRAAVEVELLQGSGTGFGDQFDPDDVQLSFWGTARFRALGCDAADFTVDAAAGTQEQFAFRRLTAGLVGLPCRFGADDPVLFERYLSGTQGLQAAGRRSNLYLDPDQPGQGFSVEVATGPNGEATLVVAWYAFADGQPLWLIGSGPLAAEGATELALVSAVDGTTVPWGTLSWSFEDDCVAASVSYRSSEGAQEGDLDVTALTRGPRGAECR